jgi:phosphoglycolate phosphatase
VSEGGNAIRHVLWDWNGTLLDDLDVCVRILNVLCERRGMRCVSREEYLEKFTFPVVDYYRAVGFDFEKEPFEVPAQEWIALYGRHVYEETRVHPGAREVLAALRERGIGQSILSAHHKHPLEEAVRRYRLDEFFDDILGIDNHYAESKVKIGREWLESTSHRPKEVLLVGDTLHDHEVAEAMGIGCVLVANGHQNRRRLVGAGVPVLDDIADVPAFVLGRSAT